MKVIIYTNQNGNVSVCVPTGELPIETVLAKDCPSGAIIVEDSTLPQGDDALFFDAWKLNGSTVTVDVPTAIAHQTTKVNQMSYTEFQHRNAKLGARLTNVMSDEDWTIALTTARSAITASTTTTELVSAIAPIQSAITANAL